MEKNYLEELKDLKSRMFLDISYWLSEGETRTLRDPMYVTYLYGDGANTFVCEQVGKKEGKLFFNCIDEFVRNKRYGVFNEDELYGIDVESINAVLNELNKNVRHDMLIEIRDIAKAYGGKLTFRGEHPFQIEEQGNVFCNLTAIHIEDGDSELVIEDTFEGDNYSNSFSEVGMMDLKLLLDYAREFKKKKFRVWVRGSFSRDFEIEAGSEEEALKLANEEWQNNPLCLVDSNGEDWNVNKC